MYKKRFPLVMNPEFAKALKVEAAKKDETMTTYVVKAIEQRMKRESKGSV